MENDDTIKAIKLMDVWKAYNPNDPVLKGVNLEVEVGSFISIRGRSGSGKSTLLRIIGLIDQPTRGKAIILGNDSSKMKCEEASQLRLKHIGFVFQSFNLIPSLTVFENIEIPLALAGVKKDARRRRVMELLESFEMLKFADRYPNQLSGGEQQRVAVLRALANNPDIILADEPTSSLDEENSELLIELFKRINKEELVTIIITTVSREEVLPTHHDYLLKNGKLTPLR
ncbi:MAG: ABC transporter ATP-binding protein [Thermoproteota archaeon]